ncbi:MAG: DoxX family protein [Ginsengibacter sp.]
MAMLYVAAGINHFINPQFYLKIMPAWLGWQSILVMASGACEILFGLLLIPVYTRAIAAWCIIGLLIAVFPANIQMMLNYLHENNPKLWVTIIRLPLQFILIWWAYLFTKAPAAGTS